jgi:hypothetical protein
MSDIFISYSKPGRPLAQKLAKLLGKSWTVWWDPKIPPGRRFAEVIHEELEKARCVVVLWSKHSVKSHYVCEEAEFARGKGKLVPVLVEEADIPVGFRTIEAANLIGGQFDEANEEYLNLLAELRRRLGAAEPAKKATPGTLGLADILGSSTPHRSPFSSPTEAPRWLSDFRGGTDVDPNPDLTIGLGRTWAEIVASTTAPAPKTGVLFEDDFADNRNNWLERRDHHKIILRVRPGRYEIGNKVDGQSWCTWRAMNIDPAGDFEIEAEVTPFGFAAAPGRHSQPQFGVLWGGKDVNNFFVVLFQAEGYMAVKRIVGEQWSDLIPWHLCAPILQTGSARSGITPDITVGIRKKAKVIEFTVNRQWVEDAEFEPFLGSNVGFFVCNEVDIWVKRLKVSQL